MSSLRLQSHLWALPAGNVMLGSKQRRWLPSTVTCHDRKMRLPFRHSHHTWRSDGISEPSGTSLWCVEGGGSIASEFEFEKDQVLIHIGIILVTGMSIPAIKKDEIWVSSFYVSPNDAGA